MQRRTQGALALADGTTFTGASVGASGFATGEVVFNTSMTGYQEILTDPSYHGQILCLTTAEVGVYGVSEEDFESDRIQVRGFLVRRLSPYYSSWRSRRSLGDWPGPRIDRRIVRVIRQHGGRCQQRATPPGHRRECTRHGLGCTDLDNCRDFARPGIQLFI